jgi:hypothetical protein
MYIPAVPYTAENAAYIQRQKECFIRGSTPPDLPTYENTKYKESTSEADILSQEGRIAMGLSVKVV